MAEKPLSSRVITVFGGSIPDRETAVYQQAVHLGKLLADLGFTVQTGGYMGLMEAVSRGAADAGGHVIGVTCDEIEQWRPEGPNPWIKEEHRFPTLRERLFFLIDSCEAAIALPGGIGTLAEIALMWTEFQIHPTPLRPFILVGRGWEETFHNLFSNQTAFIRPADRERLIFAPDPDQAAAELNSRLRILP